MVIYIDILVILNILVNFLLLLCAKTILRTPVGKIRLILSSVFGGLFSLVLLLPDMGVAVSVMFRVIGAVIMTGVAFRFVSPRAFLRSVGCVCLVSFAFAGVLLAVYLIFKPENMALKNGAVYFQISVKLFVISAVICYLFIKLILFLVKRHAPDDCVCVLTVAVGSKSVVLKAIVDTGNSLSDPFTGHPVTVVERGVIGNILQNKSENGDFCSRVGVLPTKTALGEGMLVTVRADRMTVEYGEKRISVNEPVLALFDGDLSGGEYNALLNPQIIEFGRNTNEKNQ